VKLLAFDMGRVTGVAFGDVRGAPACHTEILAEPNDPQEIRFCQALRKTSRLIDKWKPDAVVIEKGIAAGVAGKEARVQQAFGYRGCIFGVARMKGVKVAEYSVGDIREYLIGERSLRTDMAKPRVFEACKRLGWKVANFDESDAAAAWHLGRVRLFGVSMVPGLFGDELHARDQ
jgi:Holliday junction resolvasome RuvABC endonuclease subunit